METPQPATSAQPTSTTEILTGTAPMRHATLALWPLCTVKELFAKPAARRLPSALNARATALPALSAPTETTFILRTTTESSTHVFPATPPLNMFLLVTIKEPVFALFA